MAKATDNADQPALEPPDVQRPASAAPTEQELEEQSPGGSSAIGHDPYAALRIRGYQLYSLGWMASVIGLQVQSVAVGWQLFQRAGSVRAGALALGWVGGVQALPVILLALPAGQLADHFDRRSIVMIGAIGSALASIALALASHWNSPVGLMYLFLGLGATAQAISWPARSALLPQIVPAEVFSNAATWNSSTFQIASMAGPALGGLVIYYTLTGAYVLDAACSLVFFAFLLLIRPRAVVPIPRRVSLASLLAGVRFVWRTRIILATISLDLFAVLLGGAVYLIPAYAKEILHVGPVGFGWLRAAPAIGAFAMAIVLAHLPPMKRAGATMLWAVAGFGAATIVFGLSKSFAVSFLMLAATGGFDNISVVVRHTLVQMLPPENMRGRVSAVNNIFIGSSNEIGGLESGLTGWLLGPVVSVVAGGVGTLIVVALVALLSPQIRKFGSLQDARPLSAE